MFHIEKVLLEEQWIVSVKVGSIQIESTWTQKMHNNLNLIAEMPITSILLLKESIVEINDLVLMLRSTFS